MLRQIPSPKIYPPKSRRFKIFPPPHRSRRRSMPFASHYPLARRHAKKPPAALRPLKIYRRLVPIAAPPTSLPARRRMLFLQTLHRSPSCVVCAAALKFCSASWLNLRRLTCFASSVIGAQLRLFAVTLNLRRRSALDFKISASIKFYRSGPRYVA